MDQEDAIREFPPNPLTFRQIVALGIAASETPEFSEKVNHKYVEAAHREIENYKNSVIVPLSDAQIERVANSSVLEHKLKDLHGSLNATVSGLQSELVAALDARVQRILSRTSFGNQLVTSVTTAVITGLLFWIARKLNL